MINKNKHIGRFGILLCIILVTAVLLPGLTGCHRSVDEQDENLNTGSGSSEPEKSPAGNGSNTETENPVPDKTGEKDSTDFKGEWTVQNVLAYSPVGTYSKSEAERLIGIHLIYSDTEAHIFNDQPSDIATIIEIPEYEKDAMTQDEFVTEYQTDFRQIGIEAKSVETIHISGLDGSGSCDLILKDSTTMILVAGGTFFELTKVQ